MISSCESWLTDWSVTVADGIIGILNISMSDDISELIVHCVHTCVIDFELSKFQFVLRKAAVIYRTRSVLAARSQRFSVEVQYLDG